MIEVDIHEDCPFCGRGLVAITDAAQDADDGYDWYVWDGDQVRCDCGATGHMSADLEGAYVGGMACQHGTADHEPCRACDDLEERSE